MAIQDNKDEIKAPEKIIPVEEQAIHFKQEQEKIPEKKDVTKEEAIVSAELKREIERLAEVPGNEKEAEIQKEKISYLGEREKIEHLLNLAKEKGGEKGLVYAIQIAKKTNDPYILDLLHDSLAREGFYKDFTK